MNLKSEVLSHFSKSPKMTPPKTLCKGANANILKNEEKGKIAHSVIG